MVEQMEKKTARNLFSPLTFSIIFIIFISQTCFYQAIAISSGIDRSRQILEIGIGIGGSKSSAFPPDNGDCPDCIQPPEPPVCPEPAPPPPPMCPPPPPPPPMCPPPPPPPPPPECPPPPPSPSPPMPPTHRSPPPPKPHNSPPPPKPKPAKSPPPPPPPPKDKPDGLTPELRQNIKDILRFKTRITKDPFHITDTWEGNKLCIDKTKYKGFVCDTTTDTKELRIAGIKFNGYNFDGDFSLDDFLGNFKGQVFFHANSNNFKKGVPHEFNKLPTLYEFDMSNNKLTGGFPQAVLAGNLTFLDLRFNQFTGPVPPQAFTLDLDALFLNNNQFSGTIPQNLGSTPAVYLTLANNKFKGPIPKSIGQAGDTLLEVLFLNNYLSGCLPYEIGLLKKTELFDASGNQLTGPIPPSFGCLQSMETLNLGNNNLYGAVPEEVCSIKSLDNLTLSYNYFTQIGPKCRALMKKGILDVARNCILDIESQRSKDECEDFFMKHPRDCPALLYVPCKMDKNGGELTDEAAKKKPFKMSRAYAALQKHHL